MQAKRISVKSLSMCALFLAFSVIVSFVESMSGINALIPLPGVKMGLCNVAITACLYLCSAKEAFFVALLRPVFLFAFSANPVGFAMSFCGGMTTFLSLVLTKKLHGKVFSFAGISCISAVCHSIGQIVCACFITGSVGVMLYLPMLCAFSSAAGSLCGIIMNFVIPKLEKAVSNVYRR